MPQNRGSLQNQKFRHSQRMLTAMDHQRRLQNHLEPLSLSSPYSPHALGVGWEHQQTRPAASCKVIIERNANPISWELFKIMVTQNCPYAAVSRTFRALSRPSRIGTGNYDHVFVCIFRNKDLQEDCIKNREVQAFAYCKSFCRLPDNGNTS